MKKLLLVMTVFSLVGVAHAANWQGDTIDPNTGTYLWATALNWSTGAVPDSVETANFETVEAECRVTDTQKPRNVKVGNNGSAGVLRIMPGATLISAGGHNYIGEEGVGHAVVERGALWTAKTAEESSLFRLGDDPGALGSSLTVNGGEVYTESQFVSGRVGGGADVYLNAGLIDVERGDTPNVYQEIMVGTGNTFDISFGTIIIHRDLTTDVAEEVAAGRMTAFGGAGTIVVDYDGDTTTVTATGDPLARFPTYDEILPDGPLTLSWVNLDSDPCGSPVWVDVWYGLEGGSVTKVRDAVPGATTTSYDTGGVASDDYEWQVDTYRYGDPATTIYQNSADPNAHLGLPVDIGVTMYFKATDDLPPEVDITTLPTATWVGEPITVQATVDDDGKTDVTVIWSADEDDPNVTWDAGPVGLPGSENFVGDYVIVIPDNGGTPYSTTVSATIKLNYNAGNFLVTATVSDSSPVAGDSLTDTVQHNCAQTACGASRNQINLGAFNPADIAVNCMHDLADFARIAEDWLSEDESVKALDEPRVL